MLRKQLNESYCFLGEGEDLGRMLKFSRPVPHDMKSFCSSRMPVGNTESIQGAGIIESKGTQFKRPAWRSAKTWYRNLGLQWPQLCPTETKIHPGMKGIVVVLEVIGSICASPYHQHIKCLHGFSGDCIQMRYVLDLK